MLAQRVPVAALQTVKRYTATFADGTVISRETTKEKSFGWRVIWSQTAPRRRSAADLTVSGFCRTFEAAEQCIRDATRIAHSKDWTHRSEIVEASAGGANGSP